MQSITSVVFYRDPIAAMKWLEEAFGFETTTLVTDETGAVAHAEMSFGGSVFGIGGEWASPELLGPASLKSPASLSGAGTQFIRVTVDSIDAHADRARKAGARITQDPADQFYGDRTYRALDLEGHVWNFREPVREVSIAEMQATTSLKYEIADGEAL